jgi:IS30 family transposase
MSQSAIRREKVSYRLIKNMSETDIAKELGVARQTIVRDVAFLKKSSHNWLDGLAKDGFIFEYRLGLEKIKTNGAELQKLYKQTNDVWQKIAILKELDQNSKLYLEMLGETPTIHAYRRATKMEPRNNVS